MMKIQCLISIQALFICLSIVTKAQILTNPKVEKIADGFQFVEGPLWMEGVGLLFSDIPANRVYLWNEESGTSIYLEPSGNSNGLAFDENGYLLLAQHGPRQVVRLEEDENIVPIATHYNGMRFNSPNDLALHSDGSVFFTDPPYGLSDSSETGFNGIYRLSPQGEVQLLDSTLYRPNGIAFSPDETKLYVTDTESRKVYVWDIVDDTIVTNKQELAFLELTGGGTDGMKVDPEGFLYVTGPIGIWILTHDGIPIDTIPVPGQTTNCAWGGDDMQTLFVTSGNIVYKISNDSSTITTLNEEKYYIQLLHNHLDPFREFTLIPFYIERTQQVKINIYNAVGERITTLVDNIFSRGSYTQVWNAGEIKPGLLVLGSDP